MTAKTLAAIDTGSNAIRVIIANAIGPTELSVVEAERVPVRLGHHTFTHGELDRKTIEAAVTAYSRFRKLFEIHQVERYRAVATSALRNASNREDLIDRIYREVGIEVEVIDGEEEARLVKRAVLHRFGADDPPNVIADLGGGSLEILLHQDAEWHTSSMRVGTVRLLETFELPGAISADEIRMIRRFVAASIKSSLPEFAPDRVLAAASGGNAETLAALCGDGGKGMPTFRAASLEKLIPELAKLDVDGRMGAFELKRDRAEVVAIAALVFATVANTLGIEEFRVPGVGIREGVLLDLAEEAMGAAIPGSEPHAVAMARAFAARLGHHTSHGEQVRRIAASLFTQLQSLHELPEDMGVVLQLAALLHDVGEVVHRQSHHKHSEYLILNGRIPGLESPHREMVAAICRGHRKSMPDKRHPAFDTLKSSQQKAVSKLAALLRIADALDTDHRQRIVAVGTEIHPDRVLLRVSVAREEGQTLPTDLRKTEEFESLFHRRLEYSVNEVSAKPRPLLRQD
jgi:exopolyphosphatase/guanosine-5'-triphosphate,3'-diphosphate pyrophosphatase